MKIVRGGSGLGDSLYLRPFIDHFTKAGDSVTVCSNYPDIFIGSGALVEPFRRERVNKVCHYVSGKGRKDTSQWQDLCISAGTGEIPMVIDWTARNSSLVDLIRERAAGRKIVLVHGGRVPMGRTDGFAMDLLPSKKAFDRALMLLPDVLLVRIGRGEQLYQLPTELDLNDGTSVSDLMDVASICDGVVGQCSFAVPLAEIFNKPLLAIWAARGLSSGNTYIKTITPQKVLSKPSSRWVMDDWDQVRITEAVDEFRQF